MSNCNTLKKLLIPIFFLGLILLGLSTYRDYGASWDESLQRKLGLDTYNYIVRGDKTLFKNKDRYYGPVFELGLILIEKCLGLTDSRDIYLTRHLFNFFIFYVGVVFFYLLSKRIFKNWAWGILGSAMLALTPLIFAHSFYNSKDIPTMVFFIISSYTALKFLEQKNKKNLLFHAIASAILISTKITGILIPTLTALLTLAEKPSKKTFSLLLIYIALTGILTTLLWPALWPSPIKNFREAFEQMSNYPQSTKTLTLGKNLKSTSLPWYYIPIWIGATTPITYLISFGLGLVAIIKKPTKTALFALGWVFIPILIVILLKSNLYNGWRQMFFVYPGLLLISLGGIKYLWSITNALFRVLICTTIAISLIGVGYKMYQLHPYQHLYFNLLVDETKFDRDYWGLSYMEGLKYILNTDIRAQIKVKVKNLPGETNWLMLPKKDRERLIVGEKLGDPDYYIVTYKEENPTDLPAYLFEKNGLAILGVYKITNPEISTAE